MGNHHPRRGFMSFALFLAHIAILFLLPFSCSFQAPTPTPAAAPISGQEMLNFALSAQSRSSPFTHIFRLPDYCMEAEQEQRIVPGKLLAFFLAHLGEGTERAQIRPP